jgi:hypothetical protein
MAIVRATRDLAVRGLRAAVLAASLYPAVAGAIPIFEDPTRPVGVSGWTNELGNFVIERSGAAMVAPSSGASYSTASSLFSLHTNLFSFSGGGTQFTFQPGDVSMDVFVREDGTISGDLLGGLVTVRAGPAGVPGAGIAGGDVVFVAQAIDAAALENDPFDALFLFAVTYTNPAVSSLGNYVTWEGPYAGAWGRGASFDPWGHDLSGLSGFTFSDFLETRRIPEPATLALIGIGLAGLWLRRRKRST